MMDERRLSRDGDGGEMNWSRRMSSGGDDGDDFDGCCGDCCWNQSGCLEHPIDRQA